jgi:putative glutamine amidotransferase
MARPLIGIAASTGDQYGQPAHLVLSQYIDAVARAAGAVPVLIPALGDTLAPAEILAHLDGLLVPGDRSNIAPENYGGPPAPEGEIQDPARDATTLKLIPMALERGIPLLAICRGFQELNVALGGTLHGRVHELPGYMDHRASTTLPAGQRFAPAHDIKILAGGILTGLHPAPEATINSLHGQGIARLAPGLAAEALAPDGLIEAARVTDAPGFALGVQWHPEWEAAKNYLSAAIFAALGQAARDYSRN